MSRAEYEHEIFIDLGDYPDHIKRFVRLRWTREHGQVIRCCIQYELEINGEHGHIMRYDDSAGGFHKHSVGWPECPPDPKIFIAGVLPNDMTKYAREDITKNAATWETEVLRRLVKASQEPS